MNYDFFRYIFIGAAVLAGIMFIVSLIIFVVYRIPKVISDLSGATARKAIKNIREQNESSGEKTYKVSAVNEARGKLTDKISPSGRIVPQDQMSMRYGVDTTKIRTQHLASDSYSDQTTVLGEQDDTYIQNSASNETTVLSNEMYEQTSLLQETPGNETTLLSDDMPAGETTVLKASADSNGLFEIEYEITYIHTNEIIGMEAIR